MRVRGPAPPRSGARAKSRLISPALLRGWALPVPDGKYGKEGRGCVLIVGGSNQVPGAVVLAATGALRAGAGKVQIATVEGVAPAVAVTVPEARVLGLRATRAGELSARAADALGAEIQGCDALVLGPGMMDQASGAQLFLRCMRQRASAAIVVDAAALNGLAGPPARAAGHSGGVILTPHAGEMATLLGKSREEILERPLELALETAARLDAVVVLKGARTCIAGPNGLAFHNTAGNSGLGTSGSGDTLSGIIAGLCARGASPLQAAVWGVFLHARAGDVLARRMGREGYLARELLAEIPALLAKLGQPSRRSPG